MSATTPESTPPAGGDAPLVQAEGVNAGSAAESETRDLRDGEGSPRAGGDPAAAPGSAMETDLDPSDDEGDELVGTAEQSEGGQDDGSIG